MNEQAALGIIALVALVVIAIGILLFVYCYKKYAKPKQSFQTEQEQQLVLNTD